MLKSFKSKCLNILGLNYFFGEVYWLKKLLKRFQAGFQEYYCLKLEI
jgi:hypothetical protein